MTKMNAEVKKQWLAALRSGKYRQGAGHLRMGDTYCCLGVLCDLHAKEAHEAWQSGVGSPNCVYSYYTHTIVLPSCVVEWAGVKSPNPGVVVNSIPSTLGILNDNTVSFAEIAKFIEEQL